MLLNSIKSKKKLYWVSVERDLKRMDEFKIEEATLATLEDTFSLKLLPNRKDALDIAVKNFDTPLKDNYFLIEVGVKNPDQILKNVPYRVLNEEMTWGVQVQAWDLENPSLVTSEMKDVIVTALKKAAEAKLKFYELLVKKYQNLSEKQDNNIKSHLQDIENLQKELRRIKEENATAVEKLNEKNQDENQRQTLINNYVLQIEQQKTKIDELFEGLKELNTIKSERDSALAKIKALTQNDAETQSLLSNYVSQIIQQNIQINTLTTDLTNIKNELTTLKNSQAEALKKLNEQKELELKQKINELKKQWETEKNRLITEHQNLTVAHEFNVSNKQLAIDDLNSRLETLSNRNNDLEGLNKKNQENINASNKKELELIKEINRLKEELKTKELNSTIEKTFHSSEKSQLQSRINNLEFELRQLKEGTGTLENLKTQYLNELTHARQKESTLINEINDLKLQLKSADDDHKRENQNLKNIYSTENTRQQQSIKDLTQELYEIKIKAHKLEEANRTYQENIGKAAEKETTLNQTINSLGEQLKTTATAFDTLNYQKQTLTQQLNKKDFDYDKLKQDRQKDSEDFDEKERNLLRKINALTEELGILNNQIEPLKQGKALAEARAQTLENTNINYDLRIKELETQKLELETKVKGLIEKITQVQKDKELVAERLTEYYRKAKQALKNILTDMLNENVREETEYSQSNLVNDNVFKQKPTKTPKVVSFENNLNPTVNREEKKKKRKIDETGNVYSFQGPNKSYKKNKNQDNFDTFEAPPPNPEPEIKSQQNVESKKPKVKELKRVPKPKGGILKDPRVIQALEWGGCAALGIAYAAFGGVEATASLIRHIIEVPAKYYLLPAVVSGGSYFLVEAGKLGWNKLSKNPTKTKDQTVSEEQSEVAGVLDDFLNIPDSTPYDTPTFVNTQNPNVLTPKFSQTTEGKAQNVTQTVTTERKRKLKTTLHN